MKAGGSKDPSGDFPKVMEIFLSDDAGGRAMAKAMTKPRPVAIADDAERTPAPAATLTENEIARRAYERYLARGCENGHDVEDWLEAERDLGVGAEC
jgi:hypothetical protein